MTLKSVREDLQTRTLSAISGLLAKLAYLASLRQRDGTYSHWGLSRTHGEAAAQNALAEAHQDLVSNVLRTPLSNLRSDLEDSCRKKQVTEGEFLGELERREPFLLPPHPGTGSRRHLSSVLHALTALVKNPR